MSMAYDRARSVMVQLPGGPVITPEVCRSVVDTTDLVLRNLKITQTYHQVPGSRRWPNPEDGSTP